MDAVASVEQFLALNGLASMNGEGSRVGLQPGRMAELQMRGLVVDSSQSRGALCMVRG